MPKKPMQDVVPKGHRSIRDIPLPPSRAKSVPPPLPKEKPAPVEPTEIVMPPRPPKPPVRGFEEPVEDFNTGGNETRGWRNWKKTIIASVIVLLVVLGVILSSVFHSATAVVRVHNETVSIKNGTIMAKKVAGAQEMAFDLLVLKKSGESVVKSTGEKQVDERASGKIVVYNNQGSASQRLIKNTRFETPSGLIYRIDNSVTVPGKTSAGPGSIEVTVYADEPGEKYNIGLSDFTIPGFKGDPRYETFYARSKTPMTGGFSGVMKVVSDSDRAIADKDITSRVTKEIIDAVKAEVPADFIMYPANYQIAWSDLSQENVSDTEVRIKKEATITALVFNKDNLSRYLAKQYLAGYKDASISIKNIDELKVLPKDVSNFDPNSEDKIEFTVNGDAQFVWQFDEEALKTALAGKSVNEISVAVAQFSEAIEGITPSFRPFWRKSFPSNHDKINIEIEL